MPYTAKKNIICPAALDWKQTLKKGEKMKIDRLIGIITILLQQDKITAPELAERFEVSRRTINRDIEDLCKAGVPLVTTQGYGGGISIADGFKIDKALFTEEELQTVFYGLKGIDSVSKTSYLSALLEKLSSKGKRVTAGDMIIIDLASYHQAPLTQKIDLIKQAILGHHIITFQYFYEKGESWRRIEPYRLVFKWSAWYVFGYCLDRDGYRLFKLNRLGGLCMLEDRFPARHIPEKELDFEEHFSTPNFHLKALFCESEKYRLIEEYGIGCYSVSEKGGLLFEFDFTSYKNMREWIFSFGDKVLILEPEALREDRKKQAENILRLL